MNNNLWHTGYTTAVTPGTYDYVTLIHEIGHALGLKHTFSGARKMPAQFDSYSFTVMSYTASTQTPGNNYADFYPTTPMYYDPLAIQKLYGAALITTATTSTPMSRAITIGRRSTIPAAMTRSSISAAME